MKGTDYCIYETPCGWCTKFDDECSNIHDKRKGKPTQESPGKLAKDIATIVDTTHCIRKEYYYDLY